MSWKGLPLSGLVSTILMVGMLYIRSVLRTVMSQQVQLFGPRTTLLVWFVVDRTLLTRLFLRPDRKKLIRILTRV